MATPTRSLTVDPQRGAEPREPADAAADEARCIAWLPLVSRTFALSIEALPEVLRQPIRVAYLLCRVVDCVEDDATLSLAARERLFDAFDACVADEPADPEVFERLARETPAGDSEAERELTAHAGAVFRTLARLPAPQRAALLPSVRTMAGGMREYARRSAAEGRLRITDLPDLERYCYFVAGTVGELLTRLFTLTFGPLDDEAAAVIEANAVSFGLGLQLVNVLKDVAGDLERGDCFIPVALANAAGFELSDILEERHREAALGVARELSRVARGHLERAERYTLAWPASTAAPVRLFCAVPLALALATLRRVEAGDATLRRGAEPKVSRELVQSLVGRALFAVADDAALVSLFRFADAASDPAAAG